MKRTIDDLELENEELKIKQKNRVEDLETEMNEYIQVIIKMKLAVAESEMKAAEKTYLYNQLRKRARLSEVKEFS